MKRKPLFMYGFLLLFLPLSTLLFLDVVQGQDKATAVDTTIIGSGQRYTETIPVIDVRDFGYHATGYKTAESSSLIPHPSSFILLLCHPQNGTNLSAARGDGTL